MPRLIAEARAQEHLDEITAPPWKADSVQGQTTILSSSHRPLVVPWGDIRHADASLIEEAPDLAWTVVVLCKAARALAGLDPTVVQGVTPARVKTLLVSKGWYRGRVIAMPGDPATLAAEVWEASTSSETVLVPLNPTLADYSRRLLETIDTLATSLKVPPLLILAELLT